MPARPDLQTSTQREKLLYFVMLRQMEASGEAQRQAYQRLADAASVSSGWDPRTVILDWLEAELRLIRQLGDEAGERGPQLMKATVALSNALRQ